MKAKFIIAVVLGAVFTLVLAGSRAAFSTPLGAQNQSNKNMATQPDNRNESKTAAATGCSLLTPAMLEKVLGQPFEDDPVETKALPAYGGAWGSNCQYHSKKPASQGGVRVDFLVYVEASTAEAKQTFDKAAAFFADRSKPKPSGIGDSSYWQNTDKDEPQIHVLKGKVHYSLGMQPANEKLLKDLATAAAARI
jgi:hypothetical protein